MAPPLLQWAANPGVRWRRGRAIEALCLLLCLVAVSQAVFGGWSPLTVKDYPLDYLCVPILVRAAFRFGPRETAMAAVLLSGIALWGTLRGLGPFVRDTQNESLLLLQSFMGLTALLTLAFATDVAERKRSEADRETLLRALQEALEHIKVLRGLIPICASCKKIRDAHGSWDHIETYLEAHSEARFTHGLCPECVNTLYPQSNKPAM